MNEIIQNRLRQLRSLMAQEGIDAYLVNGSDPHLSEYIPARWATRKFLSGFSGSYGWMAITHNEAVLWTDSRYFIQAQNELNGTEINMLKARLPDTIPVEKWVAQRLKPDQTVAFDGSCYALSEVRSFEKVFMEKGIKMIWDVDLFQKAWSDRPEVPKHKVKDHPIEYSGISRLEKFEMISAAIEESGADLQVICALDDLAWSFNIRGNDIRFNPMVIGYGIIGPDVKRLFVDLEKIGPGLASMLKNDGVLLSDLNDFFPFLSGISRKRILIDPARTNYAVYKKLESSNIIIESLSIPCRLKAIKNPIEIEGFRQASLADALALLDFQLWVEEEIIKNTVTEYGIIEKLDEVRKNHPQYLGPGFYPLVGYAERGAMVHLEISPENSRPVSPEGVLLFDSGGQYSCGTTDITRTIALGAVTERMKHDYTLVLKGVIALSSVCFPKGTIGCHLDLLARHALWQNGLNYGHGTSHGIGSHLCVHEGPFSIRPDLNNQFIEPGMGMSCEPGIYREGGYGIRIENMILCTAGTTTEFGQFYTFETLTLVPLDSRLIATGLLTPQERNWINDYHRLIWEKVSPHANKKQNMLLKRLTVPI